MANPTYPPENVFPLRKALDLTQEQFAERLGVTRTLVTHWEKAKRIPTGPAAILLQQLELQKDSRKQRKAT